MTDYLMGIALSNLLMALPLALGAWMLQVHRKSPLVVHLLWLLVLIKLVTPPLLQVPLISDLGLVAGSPAPLSVPLGQASPVVTAAPEVMDPLTGMGMSLGLVWLAGSVVALVLSLWRVVRFDQLLRQASIPAGRPLQDLALRLGQGLGLSRMPLVATTTARIVPLVWWTPWTRKPRIILPEGMTQELAAEDLRWVLAHELAHVRRRDHVVRWFEWLVCVAVWWNPICWIARRNLRISEELCCDALVLDRLGPAPRSYANSLLNAIECLAFPGARLPALASAITSGGQLELRLRSIVEEGGLIRVSGKARFALLVLVLSILPWGLAGAAKAEPLAGEGGGKPGERTDDGLDTDWLAREITARGIPTDRVPLLLDAIGQLAEVMRAPDRLDMMPGYYKSLMQEHGVKRAELKVVAGFAKLLAEPDLGLSARKQDELGGDTTREAWDSKSLRASFTQLGVGGEVFEGIWPRLAKIGIHPKALPGAHGALLRIIHELRVEGSEFILDKRLRIYMERELRLTGGQIERTINLARRLSNA